MQGNNSKRKVAMVAWLLVLSSILGLLSFFLFSASGCRQSTSVDQPGSNDSGLYVIEKDLIYDGFVGEVDLYHETLIINNSVDTACFTVESPLPDTLKHTSRFSPAFGTAAIISTPYQNYFNLPDINNSFHTNNPDSTTGNSYFWKNLKLGHSDLMEIPYSNYYGDGDRIFVEKLGTSHFLYLEIVSDYSITMNSVNPNYIDIEIKETLRNTTNEMLYGIGTELFVPKNLMTKFDPPNGSEYTNLYNLVSDNVTSPSNNKFYLYNQYSTGEGFGFFATGQQVSTGEFILFPHQSLEFVFKMTIEPLLDKFEIYPTYGFEYMTIGGNRIWPASIITINGKRYDGEVHYLKECDLVLPTFILFSIDNGVFKVASPDDIVPTFTPPTYKMQKGVKPMNVHK
jgi:hypothetical protein